MVSTSIWGFPTGPGWAGEGREGGSRGRGMGQYLDGDIIVSAQERCLAAGPEHKQTGHLDDTRAA